MSFGLICACDDARHPVDPRSLVGHLAVTSRCRQYAVDQQHGGPCADCEAARHAIAAPEKRDDQQRPFAS